MAGALAVTLPGCTARAPLPAPTASPIQRAVAVVVVRPPVALSDRRAVLRAIGADRDGIGDPGRVEVVTRCADGRLCSDSRPAGTATPARTGIEPPD